MSDENISFEDSLKIVIDTISQRASEENKKTDAWKDLFAASENGLRGLLSKAESDMKHIGRITLDVIKEKYGITPSKRLRDLVYALPFAMWEVRTNIHEEQGLSCCADKARETYYQEVLVEIRRLINE